MGTVYVVALFTFTSFCTAALLFLVQPMVGRMVLPAFGGSPQVWTTSMLFFQVALLVGYGYTHLSTTRLDRRTQPVVHLVVAALPLLALPIALTVSPSGSGGITPAFELLGALVVGVAAPFILIATSGPLIQRWFSWTDHPRASDPYFLYAAGNVGSAAGLVAYPFVLEPLLSVRDQSLVWAGGYVLVLVLLAGCWVTLRSRSRTTGAPDDDEPTAIRSGPADPIGRDRALRWVGLAFIPSALMLAATTTLSTDVAAVPLLWVAPLGAYLLTFTVAFSSFGPTALRAAAFVAPAVIVAAISIRPLSLGVMTAVVLQILLVLVGGLLAHGKLAAQRPDPALLTRFYLLLAVGGALGGFFNGIIAPLLFPTVFEYGIAAALTLALVIEWRSPLSGAAALRPMLRAPLVLVLAGAPVSLFFVAYFGLMSGVGAALVTVALLGLLLLPWSRGSAVGALAVAVGFIPAIAPLVGSEHVERTFFGIHRVEAADDVVALFHGSTLHGLQDQSSPAARREAGSYYHREQPLGDVVAGTVGDERGATLAVVGLGSGAVATYGRTDQTVVFHEIDPAVVEIARDHFTYLEDTPAHVEIVLGDGRLTLEDVDARYDLLVLDAFTSDAVPVHLLTVEAFGTYLNTLSDDGVIAVHISNRYLELAPVLSATVDMLDIDGVIASGDGAPEGATPSRWVALARTAETLQPLRDAGWEELPEDRQLWTDQRSSIFAVTIR